MTVIVFIFEGVQSQPRTKYKISMTIRRIFPNTTPVKDYESFRQRAINLYREWLREVKIKHTIKH